MKKLVYLFKETKALILKHKLYFLTPLLIALAILAVLYVKLGAGIIMTFIYAGV